METQSRSSRVRNAGTPLTEKQAKLKAYKHQWYLDKIAGKYHRLPPRIITECAACGKTLSLQPNQKHERNYCNYKCMGAAMSKRQGVEANGWRGGRRKTSAGYIQLWIPPESPFFAMCSRARKSSVFEHRLIMAKHIGRCLFPWEIVHHKNGIKDDNRLENLQLIGMHGQHNTMIERYIKKLLTENAKLNNKIAELESQKEK